MHWENKQLMSLALSLYNVGWMSECVHFVPLRPELLLGNTGFCLLHYRRHQFRDAFILGYWTQNTRTIQYLSFPALELFSVVATTAFTNIKCVCTFECFWLIHFVFCTSFTNHICLGVQHLTAMLNPSLNGSFHLNMLALKASPYGTL